MFGSKPAPFATPKDPQHLTGQLHDDDLDRIVGGLERPVELPPDEDERQRLRGEPTLK